jgi:hypothetical protein
MFSALKHYDEITIVVIVQKQGPLTRGKKSLYGFVESSVT